jgi:hypothetical protein
MTLCLDQKGEQKGDHANENRGKKTVPVSHGCFLRRSERVVNDILRKVQIISWG